MTPTTFILERNRIMTNWNTESVLALARAFMESRILLTAAELDVFTALASPKTLEEIVEVLGLDQRGTEILLDALSAIGLLEKQDDTYICPESLLPALSSKSPDTVLPMILHTGSVWQRWTELTEIVRSGKKVSTPAGLFEGEHLRAFIYAMHVIGRHAADAIAVAAKAEASKMLLDVGGATGTYAEAFLRRYPEMRATVFDRGPVIEMAKERLADSDVRDRIAFASGDFYVGPLPGGHDLVLLSAIIHQNSPEQNIALYKKCFDALVPGGRILIRDHVMNPDRIRPVGGAIFAVNMLAATEGGNCYTFAEIRTALHLVGFERVALVQDGERMDGIVEAFKP